MKRFEAQNSLQFKVSTGKTRNQGAIEYNIGGTISVRSHDTVSYDSTILQIVHRTST